MSLTKRILSPWKKDKSVCPFITSFLDQEDSSDFPPHMALQLWDKLHGEAQSKEDLFLYVAEDAIFASLYATFYEELMLACKDHPQLSISLINKFLEDKENREQLIAKQTQLHISYIEQNGKCSGCAACEHHQDVQELLVPWEKKDFLFFSRLYLGMQSIQFSLEYLIYEFIPNQTEKDRLELLKNLSPKSILNIRQFIYDYVRDYIK